MKKILFFVPILLLYNCKSLNSTSKSEKTTFVEITFKSEKPIDIQNPTFEITIYGKDKNVNSKKDAYIFTDNTIQITSLPSTIRFEIPLKPHLLLNPISSRKNVRYYIAAMCDNNNDERLKNSGDIDIDYDMKFPSISLKRNAENIVYLKTVE